MPLALAHRSTAPPGGSSRSVFRAGVLTGALLLGLPAVASPPWEPADLLAQALRGLYAGGTRPGERWRRERVVRTADGRTGPRGEIYRDDPHFVAAAERLLASPVADDAPLGAWLLASTSDARAEPVLASALDHPDRRVAFEAAVALGARGGPLALDALTQTAVGSPVAEVRAASRWAAGEIARRGAADRASPRPALPPDGSASLSPGFRRGVSWWMSEARGDDGRASFRRLSRLGVTWVSIHTWDPLQRGLDEPLLAAPSRRRFEAPRLGALVRRAHEAGLKVLFKPHLEMQWGAGPGTHNKVAMRSEADWRRWFSGYEGYLLPYAKAARSAGVDMFCVGRELDHTVIEREADWRRIVSLVRREFDGPLVYSANFDTWTSIGFWDALDFIGVSAYFPLSRKEDPSLAELGAGWDRALSPLGEASRRFGKPVLLTEAGFPAVAAAARAPWQEPPSPPDVWAQARCYEATLRALAARPFVEGAFFWLWERSSDPPFRDASHTIVDKPASFTMARWYSARP